MEDTQLREQVADIGRKLDIVLEEIGRQKLQRSEIADLRDDLLRVSNNIFEDTVEELEEFNETLDMQEVLLLGKKLIRNIGSIKTTFEQLESAKDFLADFNSISSDMFNEVLEKLDEFDRKGYFDLMRKTGDTLDTVAASFSPEDLDQLNAAIPRIADIVRRLSRPEMVERLDAATKTFDTFEYDPAGSPGVIALIRAMMSREVRTGMLYSLGLMRETVKTLQSDA
jgi:hypothetical protein